MSRKPIIGVQEGQDAIRRSFEALCRSPPMNVSIHAQGVRVNQNALRDLVEKRIESLRSGIIRVDLNVGDLNGPRGGPNDKRCLVTVPIPGGSPVVAEDRAPTAMEAARRALQRAAGEIRRRRELRRERRRR